MPRILKRQKLIQAAALAVAVFLLVDMVSAAFNPQINYQGKLMESNGDLVADGDYDITFSLYTVPSGGVAVWDETQTVTVTSGLFSVMLGSVNATLANLDFNQIYYLGVNVEGDGEMMPRKIIGAVPAAFYASTTGSVIGGTASVTNATTTNLYASIFNAITSVITNLFFSNASGTNATTTNFYTTNATTTYLNVSGSLTLDSLTGPLYANGGVVSAGLITANFLPKWNGSILTNSLISDDGSTANVAGDLTIENGKGITLGGVYRTAWPSGGGGGAGSFWATSSDSLVGYPDLAGNFAIVIGSTVTTSPNIKFEVAGNAKVDGSLLVSNWATTTALAVTGTATSTFNRGINLAGGCYAVGGTCLVSNSSGLTGGGAAGQVVFWTGANSLGGSGNFVWNDAAGSEETNLTIVGNEGGAGNAPKVLSVIGGDADGTGGGISLIGGSGGQSGGSIEIFGGQSSSEAADAGGQVIIRGGFNTFSQYTNVLINDQGGNVGIGTAAPSFTLDVAGTGRFTNNLTLSSITAGSVLFAGSSGVVSQNNSNLFWNNAANRLGIGTANPSVTLDVIGTASSTGLQVNGSAVITAGVTVGNATGLNSILNGENGLGILYLNSGFDYAGGALGPVYISSGAGQDTGGGTVYIASGSQTGNGGTANIAGGLAGGTVNLVAGLTGQNDGTVNVGNSSNANANVNIYGVGTISNRLNIAGGNQSKALNVGGNTSANSQISINGAGAANFNGLTIFTAGSEKIYLGRNGTDSLDDFILRQNGSTNVLRSFSSGAVADTLVLNAGKVGVGTTTPYGNLTVEMNTTNPSFVVANTGSSSPALVVTGVNQNGKVGIGTASPNEQLEITGNFRLPATAASGGSATAGAVFVGANRFLHNYGGNSVNNIFLGLGAGNFSTVSGDKNIGVGSSALTALTSGTDNVGFGYQALKALTSGSNNVAIGSNALTNVTTVSDNTAIGTNTLINNTSGTFNVALGSNALAENVVGSNNFGLGSHALSYGTSTQKNTALGYQALLCNGAGSTQIEICPAATMGAPDIDAFANTAIGAQAMLLNNTGSFNTAIGPAALVNNLTGVSNVAIGFNAGTINQDFVTTNHITQSVLLGPRSAQDVKYLDSSIAIGQNSLSATLTGDTNSRLAYITAIGVAAGPFNSSLSAATGSIAIGYASKFTASNQFVLGSSNAPITHALLGQGALTASPADFVLSVSDATSSNVGTGNLIISGGRGTGNSTAGGNIYFTTSQAGSAGSALQATSTKMAIRKDGFVEIGNGETSPGHLQLNGGGTYQGDLLVDDELEVHGSAYFDGAIYVNSFSGGTPGFPLVCWDQYGAKSLFTCSGADIAERINSPQSLGDGEAVIADLDNNESVVRATTAYDRRVLGVVTKKPGLSVGGTGNSFLVLAGRVKIKVVGENGPIYRGDPITTSPVPGAGMLATESDDGIYAIALEEFNPAAREEEGMILALIRPSTRKTESPAARLSPLVSDGQIADGRLWVLDKETNRLKPFAVLDLNNQDLVNVRSIISASGNWSLDENGLLKVKEIRADKLCLGETCLTESELRDLLKNNNLESAPVSVPAGGGEVNAPPENGSTTDGGSSKGENEPEASPPSDSSIEEANLPSAAAANEPPAPPGEPGTPDSPPKEEPPSEQP